MVLTCWARGFANTLPRRSNQNWSRRRSAVTWSCPRVCFVTDVLLGGEKNDVKIGLCVTVQLFFFVILTMIQNHNFAVPEFLCFSAEFKSPPKTTKAECKKMHKEIRKTSVNLKASVRRCFSFRSRLSLLRSTVAMGMCLDYCRNEVAYILFISVKDCAAWGHGKRRGSSLGSGS